MVRRVLLSLGVIALVLVVAASALLFYTRQKLNHSAISCTSCVTPAGTDPFNVLILGSDSREGLSAADLKYFDPTGQDRNSGQRSDSIVVMHVDPDAGKAVALALPRDLMVTDTKGNRVKINSFYNNGPQAVVQEVASYTGLPISHYIEVNFSSFRTITDALGGVQVKFSRAVVDPNSGLNQKAGCDTLTGNQALAFVRARDFDSDFGRIQRQQLFVRLMMSKILSAGTLMNPVKVVSLINLGLGNLKHDSGLGLGTLEGLAVKFHNLSPTDIDFRVVPSAPKTVGGVNYVVANESQAQALFTAIRANSALPPYGKQGGVSAVDSSTVSAVVLNGSRYPGVAYKAAQMLTGLGYKVLATGNADTKGYAATVVYYTPGNQANAQYLVTAAFPGASLEALPDAVKTAAGAQVDNSDAVVVLGRDYSLPRATPKPTVSGAAGPATTPSPTSSAASSPGPAATASASAPALSAGAPVSVPTGVSWFSPC